MGEKCTEPCEGLTRLEQQIQDIQDQNGVDHREIRERLSKVETENAVSNVKYETILDKLDDLSGKHDRLVGKLETLEAKPAKRWDSFVGAAIGAVAAALIAFLAARFGLG